MSKRILVCLDGSDRAEEGLPYALACARAAGPDTELILARVCDTITLMPLLSGQVVQSVYDALIDEVARYLESVAAELRARGLDVSCRICEGPAAEALLSVADNDKVDLVVLTSHGRTGLRRWLLGSVAERIVRQARAPVLLVPPGAGPAHAWQQTMLPHFRTTLVPLDGTPLSERALDLMSWLSLRPDTLHLMQATDIPTYIGREYLEGELIDELLSCSEAYLTRLVPRCPLPAEQLTVRAVDRGAADAILDVAEDVGANLIAMCTQGRGGMSRVFMGSVAEKVARAATCPVLLMNPHCVAPQQPVFPEPGSVAVA